MIGLRGDFNSGRIVGNVGCRVRGGRGVMVVNPSNSNGDAFLHYLGLLRAPAGNRV